MTPEAAEVLALRALSWLAGNEELLPIFMGATGATLDDLRERTDDPDFLASVLDFIAMDEAWLVGFCAQENLAPEAPGQARAALPGGMLPHWT